VTVAVIDTGARLTHDDLDDNILQSAAWDTMRNYGQPLAMSVAQGYIGNGGDADADGHGTHVAGIIAAEANNGLLGAGVSHNANVLPINVYNVGLSTDAIIMALDYTIEHRQQYNIRVVNMSFGGKSPSYAMHNSIKKAQGMGILSVASAGNDGQGGTGTSFPSDWDEVVSVTSVQQVGGVISISPFSSYNPYKDIAAPGTDILSTSSLGDTEHVTYSGTSMAAPVVAGIAALLFAKDPSLTPEQVEDILYSTATDMGTPGRDYHYGHGLVNADAALAAIDQYRTVTFDANGGSVSTPSVRRFAGAAIDTLPVPTRERGVFDGWYTAPFGGTKVTKTTKVTADVTYYARWVMTGLDDALVTIASELDPSKVLDIAGASTAQGAQLQLWDANTTPAQRFRLEEVSGPSYLSNPVPGYYVIRSINSGKWLISGSPVWQGSSASYFQQEVRWRLLLNADGTYTIESADGNGLVFDCTGGSSASGTRLQVYTSNGTKAQRFTISAVAPAPGLESGATYTVFTALSANKVLDVSNGSTADGGNIQIYQSNNTGAQKFRLAYDSATGYYTLTNVPANKPLDVALAKAADGTNVQIYQNNGTYAQKWTIVPGSIPGTYVLRSACGGLALDVAWGKTDNGTNVQIYTSNGTAAQQWRFKRV
jgi:uncharacterized repeat protein (TIGR02543 family)